jgi:holo-[acyl-carrier protein] synthase
MIGVDIINIHRISKMNQKDAFIQRVLTPNEQLTYESLSELKRKDQWLAGRFAAKEAIIKALPQEVSSYQDINITQVNKKLMCDIQDVLVHVTISHEDDYAIAFAMILK